MFIISNHTLKEEANEIQSSMTKLDNHFTDKSPELGSGVGLDN